MIDPNGETIRTLVAKLPADVFDAMVDELPELLEISPDKCDYISWEPFGVNYREDDIAKDYGYSDYDNMMEEGPFTLFFSDGILIVE